MPMEKIDYTSHQIQIALYAKALAHPARVAILEFLAARECCFFGHLHEVLPIAKATVSQHLSVLKDSGLIQGEFKPPQVKYCINKENWDTARAIFAGFFNDIKKIESCR